MILINNNNPEIPSHTANVKNIKTNHNLYLCTIINKIKIICKNSIIIKNLK